MKRLALLLLFALAALPCVGSDEAQEPAKPKEVKKFPRGLKPTPRHVLASAKRFKNTVGAPSYYFRFPKKLSTWGNNQYGVCVTSESAFNRACFGVFITEAEVIRWAREHGVLDGANLDQVINMQKDRGFSQDGNIYGNGGGSVVNYADASQMKAAIYQAGQDKGCLSIGISADMLPSGAGNNHGWFLSGPTNDRDEDHCVAVCGFGTAGEFCTAMNAAYSITISPPAGFSPTTQGYAMYTWNTIGFVETSSFVGMSGEVWIRNPSTIITGTGTPTPDEVYVTADPGPIPPPQPGPGPTPIPGDVATIELSQDMKAGKYEQWPMGSRAKAVEAGKTMGELIQMLAPVQPPPAPGGLERRVDNLEAGQQQIIRSIDVLTKILEGGKK